MITEIQMAKLMEEITANEAGQIERAIDHYHKIILEQRKIFEEELRIENKLKDIHHKITDFLSRMIRAQKDRQARQDWQNGNTILSQTIISADKNTGFIAGFTAIDQEMVEADRLISELEQKTAQELPRTKYYRIVHGDIKRYHTWAKKAMEALMNIHLRAKT
ncbi:MAG: hypothetical protein KJ601_04165 [Nanoarchaeota archaeon]|nr:hypothetical protein [Nanoarchaeota archaeon]